MKIEFDIDSYVVVIPDGYIQNIYEIQDSFYSWACTQRRNQVYRHGKFCALCYNGEDFLRYLNEVILADSDKKAHFIHMDEKVKNKNNFETLYF